MSSALSFYASMTYRQFIAEPPVPTASFKGKTIIVTGSSSGLGLEAARWLVRLGASRVILACRNAEKAKAAAEDIQSTESCSPDTLQVWDLDMNSYDSVLAFADRVNKELPRLDGINLNAGTGNFLFRMVEDNEETIQTNVVSLALLAFVVYPKLRETASKYDTQTHITVTGSELYERARFDERNAPPGKIFDTLNNKETANMTDRYNVSKLLVTFLVKQMAAMLPLDNNVIINTVAPAFCASTMTRESASIGQRVMERFAARRTEVGARTLVLGVSGGPETHGQYLPDGHVTPTIGLCQGEEGAKLQQRVWEELRDKLEAVRPGVTSVA